MRVERSGKNRLDIVMTGRVDSDAMSEILQQLIDKSEGIKDGKMMFDIVDYQMPTLGAIMVELSRLPAMLSFIRKFDSAAVLADETWVRKISEWEGHILPWLTIKSFHRDQKAEAEIWLASR